MGVAYPRRSANAKPNCEIRFSNIRQFSRGCRSHDIARNGARRRRLPFRSERGNASRQPLVLPHRSHHQKPMLVSPGGRRKAFANRPAKCLARRKADRADSRGSIAAFGRGRARRTTPSDENRTGETQACADCGDAGGYGRDRRQRGYATTGGRAGRERTINCGGGSANRSCRGSACRSGFISRPARYGPDAVGRHDRRAGARRHHGKRRLQIRRLAAPGKKGTPGQNLGGGRSQKKEAAAGPPRRGYSAAPGRFRA